MAGENTILFRKDKASWYAHKKKLSIIRGEEFENIRDFLKKQFKICIFSFCITFFYNWSLHLKFCNIEVCTLKFCNIELCTLKFCSIELCTRISAILSFAPLNMQYWGLHPWICSILVCTLKLFSIEVCTLKLLFNCTPLNS